MNVVDFVIKTCKDRKIPISRLESDLGFANGYIRNLKRKTFPADRLQKIAAYLDLPLDYVANCGEVNREYSARSAHITAKMLADPRLIDALEKYFSFTESQKQHILQTIDIISGDKP